MALVKPENSKKAVSRAGATLLHNQLSQDSLDNAALDVLNNWRLSHSYPLDKMVEILNNNTKKIDTKFLIAQRIKRVPSIVGKLERFPQMRLSRMQDLGGCRAVVSSIDNIYSVVAELKSSRFLHKLKNEKDYIANPKESGYRGYHLVYAFENKKHPELNGLQIEMQIRTGIQHSWATAIEVIGAFTAQSLKSSLGNINWLEFFQLVSDCFYSLERNENLVCDVSRVKEMAKELNIVKFLNACALTVNHIDNNLKEKAAYYLMELNPSENLITVTNFHHSMLKQAGEHYLQREKDMKDVAGAEVALVSTNELENLRNAYPNYFADTKTFMNNLTRVIGN
jgi:RelA/SpoT family protein